MISYLLLRTAYAGELNLKKDVTSYDDLLDSLRLSLKGYQKKNKNAKQAVKKMWGFRYSCVIRSA